MTASAQTGLPSSESTPVTALRRPLHLVHDGYVFRSVVFVVIGLFLYAMAYAASEGLVYRYGEKNRFFAVKTARLANYDFVILGASHAMPLGFEDMNDHLHEVTGANVLNLSTAGAGIVLNRILLDYFLTGHKTKNVLYVIDSFVFYSAEWNEERLRDARLYLRAPFDPGLAAILFRWHWPTALSYVSGFAKINNEKRFERDINEDEAMRFGFAYRPNPMIDKRRMKYLYPEKVELQTFGKYFNQFEEMAKELRKRGIRLIVIKPPLPEYVYEMIPGEDDFDRKLKTLLDQYGAPLYDFTHANNAEGLFYNTDHLNRAGTRSFIDGYLKNVLRRYER